MKNKNLLKALGPGILFASTAIGVSHLVQSTTAGATFGFGLLWAVILANLFKYPFFEYGARYASATGTSLIDGYDKLGRWALLLFLLISVISMFLVSAAVGSVTSGFMENLFGINKLSDFPFLTTIVLFSVCIAILITGKYSILDGLIKVIGIVLLTSTLLAFAFTLYKGPQGTLELFTFDSMWGSGSIAFLLPLMGWMPTAVDLSTWSSIWVLERAKQTKYKPTLKETLFDFNFGYLTSALLAICFITLGAFLMFGTGQELPKGGAAFANFVVNLYTKTMGQWSYIIIAASAFSIMFGTCVAVFDGYARVIEKIMSILLLKSKTEKKSLQFYRIALLIIVTGSFLLIYIYHGDPNGFRLLVNLATTISFLVAPIVAVFNFILVRKKYVGKDAVPPLWMRILSYCGIIFLTGFSIFYITTLF